MITLGPVAGWGLNTSGQALPPPGLSNVVAVAASTTFSMALKADGTIVTWGSNVATNVPAGLSNVTAKQVEDIAKQKMPYLNAASLESAINSVRGTARSMGIDVVG